MPETEGCHGPRMTLARKINRFLVRILIVTTIAAFVGFAYGRSAVWGTMRHQAPLVVALCGQGTTIDLVRQREIEPDAPPSGRGEIAEWFACRDGAGRIVSDRATHDRVVIAGSEVLAALAFAALVALWLVGKVVFTPRRGRDGDCAPSPAGRLWRLLAAPTRLRIKAGAFAIGLGFLIALVPMAITVQSLAAIPGAGALFCDSGKLSPYGYVRVDAFASSRGTLYTACLDRDGNVVRDDVKAERIGQGALLLFWLPLAALLYPLGRLLFGDRLPAGWRGTVTIDGRTVAHESEPEGK